MAKLFELCVVAVAIGGALGCGTMANLEGRKLPGLSLPNQEKPTPFGGVGRDLRWTFSGLIFLIGDLPFSLIGDIITLPKVLQMRFEGYELRQYNPSPVPDSAPAKTAEDQTRP